MAYFIINQYDSLENITVSKMASKLYFIQRGTYSDKENMENNMKEFTNYIYNVENNMYCTYIGISKSYTNALKIQEFYKKTGYEVEIKEKVVDNNEFVKILDEYDNLLSETEDEKAIEVICNQVLSKYEEFKNEQHKNKQNTNK